MSTYFNNYEVHGVRETGGNQAQIVPDEEADYWSIYGKVENLYCAIGDFETRAVAEIISDMMNNKNFGLPPQ